MCAAPRRRKVQLSRHRSAPEPAAAELGQRVKALRLERGFTFDAFVEESSLGRGYVSQMERGLVVPTLTTLLRIAAALEIHLLDLLAIGESPVERFAIAARDLSPADVQRLVRAAERLATKARSPDTSPKSAEKRPASSSDSRAGAAKRRAGRK